MRNIKPLTEDEKLALNKKKKEVGKLYFFIRLSVILCSSEGMIVRDLCSKFGFTRHTIYRLFNRYEQEGLDGLYIREGRGVKATLDGISDEIKDDLELRVAKHPQDIKPVCAHLSSVLDVEITKFMLSRYLKKS